MPKPIKVTLNMLETDALFQASNVVLMQTIPFNLRLGLRNMQRQLSPVLQDFHDAKTKLVEDYATKDKDGKPVTEAPEAGGPPIYVFGENKELVDALWEEISGATHTISHQFTDQSFSLISGGPELDALELLFIRETSEDAAA